MKSSFWSILTILKHWTFPHCKCKILAKYVKDRMPYGYNQSNLWHKVCAAVKIKMIDRSSYRSFWSFHGAVSLQGLFAMRWMQFLTLLTNEGLTYYGEKPLASWTCYSIKHHPLVSWKSNLFRHTRGSKQAARGFPPLLEQLLAFGFFLFFSGREGVSGGGGGG